MRNREECIAVKCFAYLWLDSEYDDIVFCRVTVEDLFRGRFTAKNREEAIEIFKSGEWKNRIAA